MYPQIYDRLYLKFSTASTAEATKKYFFSLAKLVKFDYVWIYQ
jgi:hypothetical protein